MQVFAVDGNILSLLLLYDLECLRYFFGVRIEDFLFKRCEEGKIDDIDVWAQVREELGREEFIAQYD